MKITGKISAGMTSVVKTMKDSTENFKIDGKIAAQEKKIQMLIAEIGNLTLCKLDSGEQMAPEFMERYDAIRVAREETKSASAEKNTAKVLCSECGAKTAVGMRFCGVCGTSIEA